MSMVQKKGKFLYDGAGKRWEDRYKRHVVAKLEEKADDLASVCEEMNKTFGKSITGDKANMRNRYTILTPSVEHKLSEFKSIKGTRSNYCYYSRPNKKIFHKRRYLCGFQCKNCTDLDFLKCSNTSCGSWFKESFKKK